MKDFIKVGKSFKNKSGKSGTLILSEADIKLLTENYKEHEQYGKQVSLLITGSMEHEYGYSLSLFPSEKPQVQSDSIESDSLPF